MSSAEDCRAGRCPYQLEVSDEEIEAMEWLLKTLNLICRRKKTNADKAALAIKVLHATGQHMQMIVDRVHEVEDVLHAAGLREVEVKSSEIERLAPGELN